ncbi:sybindin-like family protein [Ophiostoma piceae UAMH 11346]|uniref:Trafficking protein particle complex subunit n=1 Tax=Ophiostoma piceae (strain UAMH 11346) TaxID=1262450 RepID=S3C6T5_OPHP1|nr:sybindin-like family protein [Ophiostoma piceae UAMH 11346]
MSLDFGFERRRYLGGTWSQQDHIATYDADSSHPICDSALFSRHTRTIFSLIVINKAGGLVYNKTFHEGGLNQLSTNDYLIIAGTFHGVHAITTRLNPLKHLKGTNAAASAGAGVGVNASGATGALGGGGPLPPGTVMTAAGLAPCRPDPPSGLEVLETENFRMQCFTTITGTKFLLFADTAQANVDATIRRIYDLYSDYVMKNPFYQLEMPIRCDMFDRKLYSYIREINNR